MSGPADRWRNRSVLRDKSIEFPAPSGGLERDEEQIIQAESRMELLTVFCCTCTLGGWEGKKQHPGL